MSFAELQRLPIDAQANVTCSWGRVSQTILTHRQRRFFHSTRGPSESPWGERSSSDPDRGGERAALFYSLIGTARMNDVDPQAWLADVLARIANHPARSLDELMP